MTPFALLARLAGLSHREASEFLSVRLDTVKSWSSGRNNCPTGAIDSLRHLVAAQERAAILHLSNPDRAEFGYPADDAEARSIGWPCVGAWSGMAARVIAGSAYPVKLIPHA